jgi:hypothetical protein
MRKSRWPAPPVSGGFGFPLGFAAGIVATTVAVAAGAAGHPGWSVAALAAAVAAVSAVTTLPAAVGTAAVCWFLHDGFVLGRHGDLVFTTASARAAVILVLAALVAVLLAGLARAMRSWLAVPRGALNRVPQPRRGRENLKGLSLHD